MNVKQSRRCEESGPNREPFVVLCQEPEEQGLEQGFSSVKLIPPGYGVMGHGLRGPWVEKFDCRYQMPKCGD